MKEKILVFCYNRAEVWTDRAAAIEYYENGAAQTDPSGSEHGRYFRIAEELRSGDCVCSDTLPRPSLRDNKGYITGTHPIWSAACNGDIKAIQNYFQKPDAFANLRQSAFGTSHSLIMGAARNRQHEAVKLLLSYGEIIAPHEIDEYMEYQEQRDKEREAQKMPQSMRAAVKGSMDALLDDIKLSGETVYCFKFFAPSVENKEARFEKAEYPVLACNKARYDIDNNGEKETIDAKYFDKVICVKQNIEYEMYSLDDDPKWFVREMTTLFTEIRNCAAEIARNAELALTKLSSEETRTSKRTENEHDEYEERE